MTNLRSIIVDVGTFHCLVNNGNLFLGIRLNIKGIVGTVTANPPKNTNNNVGSKCSSKLVGVISKNARIRTGLAISLYYYNINSMLSINMNSYTTYDTTNPEPKSPPHRNDGNITFNVSPANPDTPKRIELNNINPAKPGSTYLDNVAPYLHLEFE